MADDKQQKPTKSTGLYIAGTSAFTYPKDHEKAGQPYEASASEKKAPKDGPNMSPP